MVEILESQSSPLNTLPEEILALVLKVGNYIDPKEPSDEDSEVELKLMNTLVNYGEIVAPYIENIKFDTLEAPPKPWEDIAVGGDVRRRWNDLINKQDSWLVKLLAKTINLENIIFGSTFSEFQLAVKILDITSNSPNRINSIIFTKDYASIEEVPFELEKIYSTQDFMVILNRFEGLRDMRFIYNDGNDNARSEALLLKTVESTIIPPSLTIRRLGYNNTHSKFADVVFPLLNLPLLDSISLTWEDFTTAHLPTIISPLLVSFHLTLHGWECNEHATSIEESFQPLLKYLTLHPKLRNFSIDIEETSLDDPVDDDSLDSLIYCITRVIENLDQIPLIVIKVPFNIANDRNFVPLLTSAMKIRGSNSSNNVTIICLMIEGDMAGTIMRKGELVWINEELQTKELGVAEDEEEDEEYNEEEDEEEEEEEDGYEWYKVESE